ncbi:MAG: DEAD/DEAH box helicase [Firmicutes bacterium]|nr:DEAD/DEAH box helicase [Bacillota bacterium]
MNISQITDTMLFDPRIRECVVDVRTLPPRDAVYREIPDSIHPLLKESLASNGIHRLYLHQSLSFEHTALGRNVVVVTPTASGKTLCYNLPVIDSILKDPASRAIYLFPTKALSQDQVAQLQAITAPTGRDIKTYTYDGDTPESARKAIRSAGHVVVTNPDMLHKGILPHHTKWLRLFQDLKYVVVDELHTYRGVFGSHVANVLRRLRRVARFYGSDPQFICCSATIANPLELAERLTGEPAVVVDANGAPSGEKQFILYNPPVVNRELGIRKSCLLEAKNLASRFVTNGVQTIVFARSRLAVEVLVTYLKDAAARGPVDDGSVRGYRGGYLPAERRAIERGLRDGSVTAVVATDALELGIDIGQLRVAVMAGYPGTIASAWQQAGRAGRRRGRSLAIMVMSSSPVDQFIAQNPAYFFEKPAEHGHLNPDNLYILMSHLKCAAFELPFEDGESFGAAPVESALQYLAGENVLHHSGNRWFWMSDSFPAEDISLRSASSENFVIIDTTDAPATPRVIGEMDRFSAPMLIHQDAIYIHGGQQYHVDRLDYAEKKAYVTRVNVDYYTDANLAVSIRVLRETGSRGPSRSQGEVVVTSVATMFKKIKFYTHENVGSGRIHLPEEQMQTAAYWFTLPAELTAGLTPEQVQSALLGISNAVANVSPLYLMCSPRDIGVVNEVRSPHTRLPTVYLYDSYPGGIGLAEKAFEIHEKIVAASMDLIASCPCKDGCPSCVGPTLEVGPGGKGLAIEIMGRLMRALHGVESGGDRSGPETTGGTERAH